MATRESIKEMSKIIEKLFDGKLLKLSGPVVSFSNVVCDDVDSGKYDEAIKCWNK